MKFKPDDAEGIMDLLVGARGKSEGGSVEEKKSLDVIALLSLPAHLRNTAYAIHKVGKATATMIADVTGEDVDTEMSNLRELEEMGYLEEEKQGQDIYFYIVV